MAKEQKTTTDNYKRPYVLDLDAAPWQRDEKSASMVLNGVVRIDSSRGFSISNEPGNTDCYTLPSGYSPVGHVNIDNGGVVIFSTNGTTSEIGLARDCNYTQLISSACLNFSTAHPIKGTFRMRNGCERNIYFVDGFNDDKHIDIDNLDKYGSPGSWDCEAMTLAAVFQIPNIDSVTVDDSGGAMPVGSLKLSFRYKDVSGNVTPVFLVSNPIVIYDESNNGSYDNITGGYDEAAGQLDFVTSNKSITVTLSNLDQSFNKLEVIATHYNNGDGITTTNYVVLDRTISGPTLSFIYSGPNNGSESIDPAEIQIDPVVYPISKEIIQFDNRLVRADVKTRDIDWKEFQKAANDIRSSYSTLQYDAYDLTSNYNAKSSTLIKSFMSDEIYAIGIRWILKDGTFGPVLHIPGREADTDSRINITTGNGYSHIRNQVPGGADWDTQPLEVVSVITDATTQVLEKEVKHLGVTVGQTVPRWKVYNTAQPLVPGNELVGIMAYHESNNEYDDVRDCDGVPIYPHDDLGGGSYAMHKIRHHRLPDSMLVNNFSGNNLRYFNMLLSNIAAPAAYANDVQGYQIVMAKPERTVLAKGLLSNALYREYNTTPLDIYYQPMPFYRYVPTMDYANAYEWNLETIGGANSGTATELGCFVSADFLYNNEFPYGVYVKSEGVIKLETEVIKEDGGLTYTYCVWKGTWDSYYNLPNWANRIISDQIALGFDQTYDSFHQSGWVITNGGEQQEIIFHKYEDEITNASPGGGHGFAAQGTIGEAYLWYASIKNTRDVYSNIQNLEYLPTDNVIHTGAAAVVTNGDTINAPLVHKKTVNSWGKYDNLGIYGAAPTDTYSGSFSIIPVESRTNFALAHESSEVEILYKNVSELNFINPVFEDRDENGNTESHFDEHLILYNPDMFTIHNLKFAFGALDNTCSDCSDHHPNMIVYSGAASQDNLDAYKTTLANNFTQVEGSAGAITGLFGVGRSLFVRTEQSLFQQTPSAATLKGDVNVYLGTGEFFSLPANEIIKTNIGYGGSQNRFDYVSTPYGTFYVNRAQGKIYQMINGQLNPISDKRLSRFLKKNLPSQLIQELRAQGYDYALADAICDNLGLGVQTVYDPHFERIIFNVKDFYPRFNWTVYDSLVSYNEGDFVYDPATSRFYRYNGVPAQVELDFTQSDYFENRSFTLSYSPREQEWISFHSYHPQWMYNSDETFYSIDGNAVHRHEFNSKFTSYFGVRYPFLIEVCNYVPMTTTLEAAAWHTKVEQYDTTRKVYKQIDDVTFNSITAYTDSQSMGERTITVKGREDTYNMYSANVIAEKVDENWRVGNFRDYISDHTLPMFTSSFDDSEYAAEYNLRHGYMDKVPYASAYNYSLSEYQLSLLRGKDHYVRLEFNPEQDYRISVDTINLKTKYSFR